MSFSNYWIRLEILSTQQRTSVRAARRREDTLLLPGQRPAPRLGDHYQRVVTDGSLACLATPFKQKQQDSKESLSTCLVTGSQGRNLNSDSGLENRRQVENLEHEGGRVSYGRDSGEVSRASASSGYPSQGVGFAYDSIARSDGAFICEPATNFPLAENIPAGSSHFAQDSTSFSGGVDARQRPCGSEAASGMSSSQGYNPMAQQAFRAQDGGEYHAPGTSTNVPVQSTGDTARIETKASNAIAEASHVFYQQEQQQHETFEQLSPPFQAFLNMKQEITVDEETMNVSGHTFHSPSIGDVMSSQASRSSADMDASSSMPSQRQPSHQQVKQQPPHHRQYSPEGVAPALQPISQETQRPYSCRFCLKRFKRKDHVVEHERTHTGERPYVCAHCGKSFAKKSNLNTHLRTHFTGTPSQDPNIERPPE